MSQGLICLTCRRYLAIEDPNDRRKWGCSCEAPRASYDGRTELKDVSQAIRNARDAVGAALRTQAAARTEPVRMHEFSAADLRRIAGELWDATRDEFEDHHREAFIDGFVAGASTRAARGATPAPVTQPTAWMVEAIASQDGVPTRSFYDARNVFAAEAAHKAAEAYRNTGWLNVRLVALAELASLTRTPPAQEEACPWTVSGDGSFRCIKERGHNGLHLVAFGDAEHVGPPAQEERAPVTGQTEGEVGRWEEYERLREEHEAALVAYTRECSPKTFDVLIRTKAALDAYVRYLAGQTGQEGEALREGGAEALYDADRPRRADALAATSRVGDRA